MKIFNNISPIFFSSLKIGDTFKYDGYHFLKINSDEAFNFVSNEVTSFSHNQNAVEPGNYSLVENFESIIDKYEDIQKEFYC